MTMHLVTVRLDRIFDVVHLKNRQDLTLFGFQYGDTRVFGVSAPGQHHLVVGEVLTVCLAKDNDWTTLLGWYNHTTRATVTASAAHDLTSSVVALVIAAMAMQDARQHRWFAALSLLWLAACSIGYVRAVLLQRRVRAALAPVKSAPLPSLAPPPGANSPTIA